jgi:hypothetical protein
MVAFVRRASVLLAALTMAVTSGLVAIAAPASAASVSCNAGQLCIYRAAAFNGWARRFRVSESNYPGVNWWNFSTNTETNTSIDESAFSVINKTGGWVRLYTFIEFEGSVLCIGNNGSVRNLSIFQLTGGSMAREVSSHSLNRTEPCSFRVDPNHNV